MKGCFSECGCTVVNPISPVQLQPFIKMGTRNGRTAMRFYVYKTCTKCGEDKALSEFYSYGDGRGHFGRYSRCKPCDKASSIEWQKKNRLRNLATKRAWKCRTFNSWDAMIQRCTNPKNPGYKWYGGRGIKVCDRWLNSYTAFLSDMGERPLGTSIDRIDVNGNYEPGNCRWATGVEQRANQRKPVWTDEQRAKQSERSKAYWAKRRTEKNALRTTMA